MKRAVILNGEFVGTTTSYISFEKQGFWEIPVIREPSLSLRSIEDTGGVDNPVYYVVRLTQPHSGVIAATVPSDCDREATLHALKSNLKNFYRSDASPQLAARQLLEAGAVVSNYLREELTWIASRP